MKNVLIGIRNKILHQLYTRLMRPIFFRFDPEFVHDMFTLLGRLLGSNSLTRGLNHLLFGYEHPILERTVAGIHFKNPVGLSAGFDKNARLIKLLPHVGFGFVEVGSITGEPCAGNPKPRLWRHPELKSIRVHYGLMNDGAKAIAKRLNGKHLPLVVGTSIAKTNSPLTCETEAGIADYLKAFKAMKDIGAYTTVNLSCPNAYGGQPFNDARRLDKLLRKLDKISTKKAVFLKLSPDLSLKEIDQLLAIAKNHRIHGLVCTNLTKNHKFGPGGLSGKAVEDLAIAQLRHIKKKYGSRFALIACGGIFSAEDAWKRLEAGADLLQLVTGMIYEGPQLISEINRGLVERMLINH